ncbi:hypothetical protein ACIHAR_09450 [Streptomyces sp. NPDC052016]|uniref:hypothetical protein n=1 Tax=Streptomyces sp. NPDC052016 TaxID=3365680 RepID=UPI0037CF750C
MNTLAGDWWESGSWWQFVITIAVGIAVGVLAAWATLRASNPKRQLTWWVRSNTPLMNMPGTSEGSELAVTFFGAPLASPRIVELVIANSGRRDITAAMFHDAQPLRFDFGAPVCTILDVTTSPAGSIRPTFDTAGWRIVGNDTSGECWVDVLPSLLSKGQEVVLSVLVDGDEKPVDLVRFPLVDVTPVSEAPGERSRALAEALSRTSIYLGPIRIRVRSDRP